MAAVAAVAAVSVEAVAATAEAAAMPEAEDAGAIAEHPIRPGDSRSPPKFKRGVTTMTHSNHDTAGGIVSVKQSWSATRRKFCDVSARRRS